MTMSRRELLAGVTALAVSSVLPMPAAPLDAADVVIPLTVGPPEWLLSDTGDLYIFRNDLVVRLTAIPGSVPLQSNGFRVQFDDDAIVHAKRIFTL